jgi:hypothetical protein
MGGQQRGRNTRGEEDTMRDGVGEEAAGQEALVTHVLQAHHVPQMQESLLLGG